MPMFVMAWELAWTAAPCPVGLIRVEPQAVCLHVLSRLTAPQGLTVRCSLNASLKKLYPAPARTDTSASPTSVRSFSQGLSFVDAIPATIATLRRTALDSCAPTNFNPEIRAATTVLASATDV